MTSRRLAILTGFGLALSVMGTAHAQIRVDRPVGGQGGGGGGGGAPTGVITSITTDQMPSVLQAAGWSQVKMQALDDGQKFFMGSAGGNQVFVLLNGTDKAQASALLSFFGFWKPNGGVTPTFLNNFNANTFMARASQGQDGTVTLQMDLLMDGGITAAAITENAKVFPALFHNLLQYNGK